MEKCSSSGLAYSCVSIKLNSDAQRTRAVLKGTSIEPQSVFDSLLGENPHPRKKAGLEIVHAICSERFESKSLDWTVSSIGRQSQERGGPTAATLRAPSSEHYRTLIAAWKSSSKTSYSHVKKPSRQSNDWIEQIDDLAIRQLVYMMRGDLERARSENRGLSKLTRGNLISVAARTETEGTAVTGITPNEARHMKRFIERLFDDPELLRNKGFVVKDGSIIDSDTGEVIADRAAVAGIRKASLL